MLLILFLHDWKLLDNTVSANRSFQCMSKDWLMSLCDCHVSSEGFLSLIRSNLTKSSLTTIYATDLNDHKHNSDFSGVNEWFNFPCKRQLVWTIVQIFSLLSVLNGESEYERYQHLGLTPWPCTSPVSQVPLPVSVIEVLDERVSVSDCVIKLAAGFWVV